MTINSISSQSAAPVPQNIPARANGAAQKMQQEATETPAQTAAEAGKGDAQAKRLLAKEDAEKADNHAKAPDGIPEGKGSNVDVTA